MRIRKKKTGRIIIGGLLGVIAMVMGMLILTGHTPFQSSITSFDSCVAAGNPILESYPEVCVAGGVSHVNPRQATVPQ